MYAVLPKNWINTLLLPCLIVGPATALANCSDSQPSIASFAASFNAFVFFPVLLGYGWSLIHLLRIENYESKAPDWTLEKSAACCWQGWNLIVLDRPQRLSGNLAGIVSREIDF